MSVILQAKAVSKNFSPVGSFMNSPLRGATVLSDISFDLAPGEMLGLIGRNGAGKTTLLKILARLLYPTSGEVTVQGSVSTLLGTGVGMHQQLTAEESIFLTGSLFGMTTADMQRRVGDILEFAELEESRTKQIKFFSNGMRSRLALSTMLHMDLADILLIDEVLAAGDIAFREKSKEKLTSLLTSGRSIIFASHNIAFLSEVADRCLYLAGGSVRAIGESKDVCDHYKKETMG